MNPFFFKKKRNNKIFYPMNTESAENPSFFKKKTQKIHQKKHP